MKKLIIVCLVGAALSALVLSPSGVRSHFGALLATTREAVDDLTSDAHEAQRIRVLLRGVDDRVVAFEGRLGEVQDRAAASEAEIARVEKMLSAERSILERSQSLIIMEVGHHQIGGQRYTRAEVEADARVRLVRSKDLESQLKFQKDLLADLRTSETEGRKGLAEAGARRKEMTVQLEGLETRLQNARLRSEVAGATRDLREAPLGVESELSLAFAGFEKRVRALERRAGSIAPPAGGIDWEDAKVHLVDIGSEVAAYLAAHAAGSEAEPTVTATSATPD